MTLGMLRDCPHAPVLGMVHALPLPGSPQFGGSWERVFEAALSDALALRDGGVNGLILENYGDVPFFPGSVPAITVAALTALASEIRSRVQLPLGINVLRNDGCSALAVACASRADFIRVNVLSGARVTDQGILEGIAHTLLRERAGLGAHAIQILADVNVKHSIPVGPQSLEVQTRDLVERALADAVIVSGLATGQSTDLDHVRIVKSVTNGCPVLIGSGVTAQSAAPLIAAGADALIVGSWVKQNGVVARPVDPLRVRELMTVVRALSDSRSG